MDILDNIKLLAIRAYHVNMKVIRSYLILCLLLAMPLQSIAANFHLACQNNYRTTETTEKKMSHCHQTREHKQFEDVQSQKASHHCLSFCAQVGMVGLTRDTTVVFSQNNDNFYSQYVSYFDSVISPSIQRPPISFS
jgi:3-mercaptopyruvate sulfurtransferase SseA